MPLDLYIDSKIRPYLYELRRRIHVQEPMSEDQNSTLQGEKLEEYYHRAFDDEISNLAVDVVMHL